jgi:MerR family transcriptional regulator, light-induced transcriptional regulator
MVRDSQIIRSAREAHRGARFALAQSLYVRHTHTVYRINVAARAAGVSPQLLRAWERRYALTAPSRTASGYRLYSDDDVAILRGAKALVDQGQSISEVARLPREQLRAAAVKSPGAAALSSPGATHDFLAAALTAVRALDGPALETLILHATSMGTMPAVEICDRVLGPLLVEIGERWEKGELAIAAEHFGSAILRRHLQTLVQNETRRNADAPGVVCACPEGDLHEGGLLAFALHGAALGWNIFYLGPNMPIDDVVSAARERRATAIALSLSSPQPAIKPRSLVQALARWRSESSAHRVWLGGRGATAHAAYYRAAGYDILEQADSFAVTARG